MQAQFIVSVALLASTLAFYSMLDFREKPPAGQPFSTFPLAIGDWKGERQPLDQKFIDALEFTDYVFVNYSKDQNLPINFYVAYYASQQKGESIHSPETCLPGSGWIFRQAGKTTVSLQSGKSMTVNRAIMEKGGSRQLVYFWFPARGRILTNAYELKLFGFWDAMTRQRTDGALVRVITPVASSEGIEDTDRRLQSFIGEIMPQLNEFIPG